jgi:hypothetical protein
VIKIIKVTTVYPKTSQHLIWNYFSRKKEQEYIQQLWQYSEGRIKNSKIINKDKPLEFQEQAIKSSIEAVEIKPEPLQKADLGKESAYYVQLNEFTDRYLKTNPKLSEKDIGQEITRFANL